MKINKRERDGVIILEVEGKVTIGKGDVVTLGIQGLGEQRQKVVAFKGRK